MTVSYCLTLDIEKATKVSRFQVETYRLRSTKPVVQVSKIDSTRIDLLPGLNETSNDVHTSMITLQNMHLF